jgi:Peptidase family M41
VLTKHTSTLCITLCVCTHQVRVLLQDSYNRAMALLTANRNDLETVAAALIEHETLSGAELKQILAGNPIAQHVGRAKAGVLGRAAAAQSVAASS